MSNKEIASSLNRPYWGLVDKIRRIIEQLIFFTTLTFYNIIFLLKYNKKPKLTP